MVEGGASLLKITKLIGLGGEVGEQGPKKGNGRDWGQTNFAKKNLQCLELAIYFRNSLFQAFVTNIVVEVNFYSWKLYAKMTIYIRQNPIALVRQHQENI